VLAQRCDGGGKGADFGPTSTIVSAGMPSLRAAARIASGFGAS
jgi:hypothetical protein